MVKSDVKPPVVISDDEFDLVIQAMNDFKPSRAVKTEPSTRAVAKRGLAKTPGTKGKWKSISRTPHSSEEVESQILNEASANFNRKSRRQSTDSVEQVDQATPVSTRNDRRPARRAEKELVGRKAMARRAASTEDEQSSGEEVVQPIRRPAGKRLSRAPKFTQPPVHDEDGFEEEDGVRDSARQLHQPLSKPSDIHISSDSEITVVLKETPKRRGRPPRQVKSLGGAALDEESMIKPSGCDRRRSAPVEKMVAGPGEVETKELSQEVPDSQQFTNNFTPLNRQEIGGRRSAAWAAR